MSKEVDADYIYNKWLYELKANNNIYSRGNREGYIRSLFDNFVLYRVDYETACTYKRKVKEDLISEEGKKNTNKRGHVHYLWLQNIDTDFKEIITEFYDPNGGLLVEKVVFHNSKFKLPENPAIIEWVKTNYGDSADLIEQAHSINNKLCHEYFTELEKKEKEVG